MYQPRSSVLSTLLLFFAMSAVYAGDPITLGDLPAPVKSAMQKIAGQAPLMNIQKTVNADGKVIYSATFKVKSGARANEIIVDESGKVIKKPPEGKDKNKEKKKK